MIKAYQIINAFIIISVAVSCSSPRLTQFGTVQKLSLENGRFLEYVLNGRDSCFESDEKGTDTYTIFYGNLDSLIYSLKDKKENWQFNLVNNNSSVRVSPLMNNIQYVEAYCNYNPIYPFRNHGFDDAFISIRFKNIDKVLIREGRNEK